VGTTPPDVLRLRASRRRFPPPLCFFGVAAGALGALLASGYFQEHLGGWLWLTVAWVGTVGGFGIATLALLGMLWPGPDVIVDDEGVVVRAAGIYKQQARWKQVSGIGELEVAFANSPAQFSFVRLRRLDRNPIHCPVPAAWDETGFREMLVGRWEDR
jgi:hypothetical protein